MLTLLAMSFVAGLAPAGALLAIPPLEPILPPDEPAWFHPVVPARLLDTRPGSATVDGLFRPGSKLGAGRSLDLQIAGRGGIPPTGVDSVVVNITVTQPTAPSFLTVWPTGAPRPTASNLNFVNGQTVPNLVVAKLGNAGNISIFNLSGATDVVVDVSGYFPQSDGFVSLVPARLLDTRPGYATTDGLGRPGRPVAARSTIELQVVDRGGVPATGVDAVVLNLTGTNPTAATHVTVWPAGQQRPTASNLNLRPGTTTPNLVIAKVGAGGNVSLYNEMGTIDLIADVAGYFPSDGTYVPLQPARILETRPGLPVTTGGDRKGTPLGASQTYDLKVLGIGGVPAEGVSAVVLNVTAILPTSPSFITVSPTGRSRPTASNLNLSPGDVRPNLVVARVGAGGHISLYNLAGSVDVVVDVAGYFLEEPAGVRDVVTNDFATCLLDWLGRTTCWGESQFDPKESYGYVLNPPFSAPVRPSPYAAATFDDAVDVTIGSTHACVLRSDATVWCWSSGLTSASVVGTGSATSVWPAIQVPALDRVVDVDAGGTFTCAVRDDGTVWCWGGQGPNLFATPTRVGTFSDAIEVSVGPWSSCALRATGTVMCWGMGGSGGMLGDGSGSDSSTPVLVAGLVDADSVDVESEAACATRATGGAVCWGSRYLGNGTSTGSMTPVEVLTHTMQPADDIWQVDGGAGYRCAVRFDDRVYCWGSRAAASLGLAPDAIPDTNRLGPAVGGLPPIDFIAADGWHMCAVTYESDVYCWGLNDYGQVGDGSFATRSTPTLVYSAFG
jgi:hypothetical protein